MGGLELIRRLEVRHDPLYLLRELVVIRRLWDGCRVIFRGIRERVLEVADFHRVVCEAYDSLGSFPARSRPLDVTRGYTSATFTKG